MSDTTQCPNAGESAPPAVLSEAVSRRVKHRQLPVHAYPLPSARVYLPAPGLIAWSVIGRVVTRAW
jgi:hypothetical protein